MEARTEKLLPRVVLSRRETTKLARIKEDVEIELPNLAEDLSDKELPTTAPDMIEVTLTDPNCARPATETVLPNLAVDRILRELPSSAESRQLAESVRVWALTLSVLPRLTMLTTDNMQPNEDLCTTEKSEPSRVVDSTLKLLPRVAVPLVDDEPLKANWPTTVTELPILTKPRRESELPIEANVVVEVEAPNLTNDRIDKQLPKLEPVVTDNELETRAPDSQDIPLPALIAPRTESELPTVR